jgi:mono/diheme cytochrome c family protein
VTTSPAVTATPLLQPALSPVAPAVAGPIVLPLPPDANARPFDAQKLDAGRKLYGARCAMCHGDTGKGDGVMSTMIKPAPTAFTDTWQTLVDDKWLTQIVVLGGAGMGKAHSMPAQADLKDKPDDVGAIVLAVRAFASKPTVRVVLSPRGAPSGDRVLTLDGDATAATLVGMPIGSAHLSVFRGVNAKAVCERDVVIDASTTTLTCSP